MVNGLESHLNVRVTYKRRLSQRPALIFLHSGIEGVLRVENISTFALSDKGSLHLASRPRPQTTKWSQQANSPSQ